MKVGENVDVWFKEKHRFWLEEKLIWNIFREKWNAFAQVLIRNFSPCHDWVFFPIKSLSIMTGTIWCYSKFIAVLNLLWTSLVSGR